MQRKWMQIAMGVVAAVGAASFAVWAAESGKEDNEEVISIDQVPPAAKAALLKAAGGAPIVEVEKEVENGVVVYEAEWVVDGKEHEAAVTADGKPYVENEDDDDDLTLQQVPPKVREALMKLAGTNKIGEIEAEKEHGVTVYEASWRANGGKMEVEVTADGVLLEMEETVDPKDVPEVVQAAAQQALTGAPSIHYEKHTIVVYEVEGRVNGKAKEVKISPTGRVQSPKPGQAANQAGDDDDDDDDNNNGKQ